MKESIVLYAAPGMGHAISMVKLGKLIIHSYSHKFSSITILVPTGIVDNPSISDYIHHVTQSYPSISFHRLCFQRPDPSTIQKRGMIGVMFEMNQINPPILRNAILEISKTSTIKALVIDMFLASGLSVGIELCIPTYYFFTSGASALAVFLYHPKFYEHTTPNNFDNPLVFRFPGISLVRPSDIAGLLRNDFLYFFSALSKANGIIVNTFDGFEPVAMKAVEDGLCVPDGPTPPVYYVGPLIGSRNEKEGSKAIAMDEEEEDYLSWLDKQPSRSVVFLCFGSGGTFSEKQVREIAVGLENSGKRFLWVLKKPAIDDKTKRTLELKDFDLGSVLPEGFTERTTDLGRVVKSWVSQVEVLKKESVGVFVTHCGWNSILEAVVAGVPMIAWPLHSEQYLNRNALVFDMGMAVPVEQREEDGFVSGTELEKRVRELMESEKGRELTEQTRKMKERSLAAFGETGSSKSALKRLIDAIE